MAPEGLVRLTETVEKMRERVNPELKIAGTLPRRVDKRTRLSVDVIDKLKQRFGDTVCKTHIRETVRLAECPSFGKPITEYDPQGRGALDYGEPADEILQQEVAGCPDGQ
ncbi:MAG: ParA family protein [Simkaniaceae bacterium]|nr:ParA family protein [Simkaniaceae bacterium]